MGKGGKSPAFIQCLRLPDSVLGPGFAPRVLKITQLMRKRFWFWFMFILLSFMEYLWGENVNVLCKPEWPVARGTKLDWKGLQNLGLINPAKLPSSSNLVSAGRGPRHQRTLLEETASPPPIPTEERKIALQLPATCAALRHCPYRLAIQICNRNCRLVKSFWKKSPWSSWGREKEVPIWCT